MNINEDFWETKKQRDILKAIQAVSKLGYLPYNSYSTTRAQKKLYSDVIEWGVMDGILRHSQGFTTIPVEFDNNWLKDNYIDEYEKVMTFYSNLSKTINIERLFLNTLRRETQNANNKDREYREVKTNPLVIVTREKLDRTIDVIIRNLYKEGDFSEIDTGKDRKRQIAQIRLHTGIQNINVSHSGNKIEEYINRAFKYGYINDVQTKEHIEKKGFNYDKGYVYQYTEKDIIKMSLNYTKMSEFKKYNFNMWMDAERKGMLELMYSYCYHTSGRGGFNVKIPGLLYYIKSQGIYKIGITNLTVEQRFSHVWHKIEIIKTWFFDNGQEARDEEKRILREFAYAKHNAEGIEGLGNTELFTHDVLLLDHKDKRLK